MNFLAALRKGRVQDFAKKMNLGLAGGYFQGVAAGVKNWRSPASVTRGVFASGPAGAFHHGKGFLGTAYNWSYGPMWPVMTALAAYAASQAPSGERAGHFAGTIAGDIGGAAIGAAVLGGPGALAGGLLLGPRIGREIGGFLNSGNRFLQRRRSLEMGGGYYDFSAARTMRQAAVREMSGSLLNARQYLGQEAAALHS